MARRGTPFIGLLYCGLAMTSKGIRVVEFNVRFGDPETQVVLERLDSDLVELLYAAATGTLALTPAPYWSEEAAVTVVMASYGYPGTLRTGETIVGLEEAEAFDGVHVIHAGTTFIPSTPDLNGAGNCCGEEPEDKIVNSGGRYSMSWVEASTCRQHVRLHTLVWRVSDSPASSTETILQPGRADTPPRLLPVLI